VGHTVYDGGQSISRRDLITRASGLAVAAVVPGVIPRSEEQTWVGAAQASFPRKNDFTIPEGVTYLTVPTCTLCPTTFEMQYVITT
ncbi:uncharacterized protein METZ01_LOCUS412795, partial [marine metagenome]